MDKIKWRYVIRERSAGDWSVEYRAGGYVLPMHTARTIHAAEAFCRYHQCSPVSVKYVAVAA